MMADALSFAACAETLASACAGLGCEAPESVVDEFDTSSRVLPCLFAAALALLTVAAVFAGVLSFAVCSPWLFVPPTDGRTSVARLLVESPIVLSAATAFAAAGAGLIGPSAMTTAATGCVGVAASCCAWFAADSSLLILVALAVASF